MTQNRQWFLHVDLDAFFASVEQLDHPEYRGKPLIVGGKPEDKRSVVSTASYEARKYGVHSAMPTYQAYKLCPHGIFVYGRMERYSEISYKIMNIFKDFSPDVDQMSIDEAFIDLTGTETLFGPPEQTAFEIKRRVKEYTGLTVSIGLATNKYLAKIASAMSKPDGFYFVKPGTEQDFMLNLPLEKVWGVGKKTLEHLKQTGIKSTKDIYNQSLDSLQFLYGNNMGNFLYNVVRGIDYVEFGKKPKTKSISTETTFVEDITDIYTIETKLLELCHYLIFRILKKQSYTRTVMVKIRYGDFSTVSIQRTVDYNILTLDSCFSLVKQLFNEKYDKKSGIRLIGVGLENLQKNPHPEQLYLFDENKEKNQNVEKAILNLEQKHPEIKVQKARLLFNKIEKITKIFIIGICLSFFSKNTFAQTNTTESKGAAALQTESLITQDENPIEDELENETDSLMQWQIPLKSLNYELSGYWAGSVTDSINSSFGNNTPFGLSVGTPIFKQEIDFSAIVNITENWFFNLEFADKFAKNTYSVGYKNEKSKLNNFLLSNRNITFPEYSSTLTGYSLSGGDNQAPGFTIHFNDYLHNKWNSDFMLRYDITTLKDATFYGKNVISDFNISLSDFMYGKIFVIPDKDLLLNVKNIFVEDSQGEYIDDQGFKYKRIPESDYLIISSKKIIVISGSEKTYHKNGKIPKVLITFNDYSNFDQFISNLGDYNNPTSYLGQIQSYFNSSNDFNINLSKYTDKIISTIDNKKALVLQQSQGFSPFLFCGLYDCGIIQNAETNVVSNYSETISNEYFAQITDDFMDFSKENFFLENHLYAEAGKYELKDESYENPAQRYPFADKYPFTYLSNRDDNELKIRLRNYSPVTALDIGKKVSGGSVRVYINGILDSGAIYEPTSGFVTPSKPVSVTDKIYITWYEETDNMENGSLSVAAGYKYNFFENFTGDISLSANIPLWSYSKTPYEDSKPYGFGALTTGINFENDNLLIKDGLSLAIVNNNLTGNYLAYNQQNDNSQTYYLSYSNGYETHTIPSIANDIILTEENNGTVRTFTGTGDSYITGYKIPLSWDFSTISSSGKKWASVDIKLNSGYLLANSASVEIAILPENLSDDMDFYLQLGIKAEKDFTGENRDFIPTWKINDTTDIKIINTLNPLLNEWQIIKVNLSDDDRQKLFSTYDLRLIAISKSDDNNSKGTIYVGPYEPNIKPATITANDDFIITSNVVLINESPSSKDFFRGENHGTEINWNNTNSFLTDEQLFITASNYFESSSFSTYKTINLDFYVDGNTKYENTNSSDNGFILQLEGESNISSSYEKAIQLIINKETFSNLFESKKWHTLSINLHDKTVLIDKTLLDTTAYDLKIDYSIKPSKFTIKINTATDSFIYKNGTIKIGNIYYKDNESNLSVKNNTVLNYSKDEFLFFKDIYLDLNSIQAASFSFTNQYNNFFNFSATQSSGFSIYDFNLNTTLGFNSSRSQNNTVININGSQSISTTSPLLNIISLTDKYIFDFSQKEIDKDDKLKIDFSAIKIPLSFELQGNTNTNRNYITQNINYNLNTGFNINKYKVSFDINTLLSQKINTYETEKFQNLSNYFSGYIESTAFIFSEGQSQAYSRSEEINSKFSLSIPYYEITPTINFSIIGNYKNSTSKTFTDKSNFNLSVPFVINKNSFNFIISKTGGGISENTNENYYSDLDLLFNSQNNKLWFYTSIPFVDLFSNKLSKEIHSSTYLNSSYSTKYELTWKRSLTNTVLDFYLPVSSTIGFSRDISSTDILSDSYGLKLTVGNSFINMLGKNGKLHWFDWFSQDEYTSFFTGLLKIPLDNVKDTTIQCSWYGSLLMFIDSQNSLRTGADFTITSTSDWKIRATGIWNHKGNDTIILKIPQFLFKSIDFSDSSIMRKESLNITLNCSDGINSEIIQYNHECDIKIKKNYDLNAGIGVNLNFTENSATTLGIELSIGGKVQF